MKAGTNWGLEADHERISFRARAPDLHVRNRTMEVHGHGGTATRQLYACGAAGHRVLANLWLSEPPHTDLPKNEFVENDFVSAS